MTEFSAGASLRLSAALAGGGAAAFGTATLNLQAGTRAGVQLARSTIDAAPAVDTVHASVTAEVPRVVGDLHGSVTGPAPNLVGQVWEWLSQRSITELLLMYDFLVQRFTALVQDSHGVAVAAVLTLPFLALVVRAINRWRRER